MANGRCRMHGGASTGPRTLAGIQRIRAARTTTGTYSAEGRAMAVWQRRYFAEAYRSLAALGSGTVRDEEGRRRDAQTYFREYIARQEAAGITPDLVEAQRQAVRAAIQQRDIDRLRAKGWLPGRERRRRA